MYRITIDYSGLSASYKDFEDDEVKKYGDKLSKAISDASLTLQKIQAPNMKVRIFYLFYAAYYSSCFV